MRIHSTSELHSSSSRNSSHCHLTNVLSSTIDHNLFTITSKPMHWIISLAISRQLKVKWKRQGSGKRGDGHLDIVRRRLHGARKGRIEVGSFGWSLVSCRVKWAAQGGHGSSLNLYSLLVKQREVGRWAWRCHERITWHILSIMLWRQLI